MLVPTEYGVRSTPDLAGRKVTNQLNLLSRVNETGQRHQYQKRPFTLAHRFRMQPISSRRQTDPVTAARPWPKRCAHQQDKSQVNYELKSQMRQLRTEEPPAALLLSSIGHRHAPWWGKDLLRTESTMSYLSGDRSGKRYARYRYLTAEHPAHREWRNRG